MMRVRRWPARVAAMLIALLGVLCLTSFPSTVHKRLWDGLAILVVVVGLCGFVAVRLWRRQVPEARVAIAPDVARSLRSSARRAWVLSGIGAALFLVFVVTVNVVENRSHDLQRTGARVDGRIVAVAGSGEHGSVRVEFAWSGAVRTSVVHLDGSSPRYAVGEPTVVFVDRSDPGRVTLSGEDNQSPLTTGLMILGLVVGVTLMLIGGLLVAQVSRARRVLAQWPLQRAPARLMPTTGRRVPPRIAVQRTDGTWLGMTMTRVGALSSSFADRFRGTDVDIAGAGDALVVRVGTMLYRARPFGTLDPAALGPPSAPLVTLRARGVVPADADSVPAGSWFREVIWPPGIGVRTLNVVPLVLVSIVHFSTGDLSALGGPVEPMLFAAALFVSGFAVTSRTVTRVDTSGLVRSSVGRRSRRTRFEQIASVERYAPDGSHGVAAVVVELDDGSNVTVVTRRPDDFVYALQRGRDLA